MDQWLVILPVILPLCAGAIGVMCWRLTIQREICAIGLVAHLAASILLFVHVLEQGPIAMAMGAWAAPFGILFGADLLGASLTLTTSVVGVFALVYSFSDITRAQVLGGFYPLFTVMIAGVSAAFLTADIFNLYVWFEIILITSCGLIILGGRKEQLDGAVKYVFLNMLATSFFLVAVALLYGLTGTLNMADLAEAFARDGFTPTHITIAALFFFAFGMKGAAFPLFFWLPASYHTPNAVVAALFGGLLTKVGIYAIIRTFTLIFADAPAGMFDGIIIVALATMLMGGLGAVGASDVRRLIAFQIVSGVGYMLLGVGLRSELAIVGSIYYMIHSMVVSAALFMASGLVVRHGGGATLAHLGGIYGRAPLFAAGFLICGLSLAGIPPFGGFWPKLMLAQAALTSEHYWAAGFVLFSGFLVLISVTKVYALAFWREAPAVPEAHDEIADRFTPDMLERRPVLAWPFWALTIIVVALGLGAGQVSDVLQATARSLLDPAAYVSTVLGGGGGGELSVPGKGGH